MAHNNLTHAHQAQITGERFSELFHVGPIAHHAARCARYWSAWGPYAARRYAQRHGIPLEILTLARVLANAEQLENESTVIGDR